MKKLLVVNACVHRDASRTNRLCRAWLDQMNCDGIYEVEEVILEDEDLRGLDTQALAHRNRLLGEGHLEHEMFRYARTFRKADEIVIAAPYWDMSFPASLKCYLEAVSAVGLTFRYQADGTPEGLCHAQRLTYITTAGGFIGNDNYGYDYVKALARLFGIAETREIRAEGLDIVGADIEAILHHAEENIKQICAQAHKNR